MAITVIKSPASAVAAKNPVWLQLESDNYELTAAQLAYLDIRFTGFPADGATFILEYMGLSETYVFKNTPDPDNDLELPANNGAESFVDDYLTNMLIPALQERYLIITNYEVILQTGGAGAATLRLAARNYGDQYSITANTFSSGLMSNFGEQANANATYRPNFKLFCDLWAEKTLGTGDDELIYSGESTPDAESNSLFNFSEVLKGILSYDLPAFSGSNFMLLVKQIRRYFFRYAESYGDTPHAYKSKTYPLSGYLWAVNGAESWLKYPLETFYTGYFTGTVKFLTSMPRSVALHKLQKQYLSCFIPGTFNASVALHVQVKLYYTDNTSGAWVDASSSTSTYYGKIVTFRVGYTELDIDTLKDPVKEVLAYEVRITKDTSTVVSEVVKFNVIQEYLRYPRFFMFVNSFGYAESMFFHGDRKSTYELSNDVVKRTEQIRDVSANVYSGRFNAVNSELQDSFEVSTGNQEKTFIPWFKDFLLSHICFDQLADKYVQILVDKQNVKLPSESDTLFATKINYKYAFTEVGTGQ